MLTQPLRCHIKVTVTNLLAGSLAQWKIRMHATQVEW